MPNYCRWSMIALTAICVGGCASLSNKPVGDHVLAARQLSLRGMESMHRGDWKEAERLFASAVESNAADERARRMYAEALWHRGAAGEAIEQMEQAARLSAGDPKVFVQLGEMQLAQGNLRDARQRAEQAIHTQGGLASAWALLGDVQRRAEEPRLALASYHRALSLDAELPRVQQSVAEIYLEQDRPQRALATVHAAARAYPRHQVPAELLYLEGVALTELQQYDDAVQVLLAACQRSQPTAEMLYQLGRTQLLVGDPTSARLALGEALKRDPNHLASYQLQQHIHQRQSQMSAAVRP